MKSDELINICEEWYVEQGFTVDEILMLLRQNKSEEIPARKTVYNWISKFKWKEAREKFLEKIDNIQDQLDDILLLSLKSARMNPGPKSQLSLRRALENYRKWDENKKIINRVDPDADKTTDKITSKTINEVYELLGIKR